jgi:DDE superfamily endonuclease
MLYGNAHDLAAARETVLPMLRNYTGQMPGLADCGYEGAGHSIFTPVKKPKGVKELDINARTRNMLLSSATMPGGKGFALLSQRWKTLQNVTARPQRDRTHHAGSPCSHAIRIQATHVKVAEKTSLNHLTTR